MDTKHLCSEMGQGGPKVWCCVARGLTAPIGDSACFLEGEPARISLPPPASTIGCRTKRTFTERPVILILVATGYGSVFAGFA